MIQAKSEVNHKKQITNLKKTHRFSRAERFQLSTYTNTDFNYNLEYRKSKRACSFGIGNRPIMINDLNSPNPDRYYIGGKMLKAQSSKKGVSIGYSRQNVVFRSLNTEVQRKALLPSPCQYKIQKQKGKAYTLGIKLPVQMYNILRQSSPAPGDYKAITMNKQGKYAISKVKNPRRVSFGSKTRTLSHNERQTGPGSYDIFNMDSKFSERNVKNLRKNHAKQFGTSQRKLFEDRQKSQTPGPGYYQSLKYIGHQVMINLA